MSLPCAKNGWMPDGARWRGAHGGRTTIFMDAGPAFLAWRHYISESLHRAVEWMVRSLP